MAGRKTQAEVTGEVTEGKKNLEKAKESRSAYKDYSGKVLTIKTVRAIPCELCGHRFDFKYEMVKYDDGSKEKVPCEYKLDSKDYGDSFNEIIHKLTRPQNKVVEIIGVE